MVGVADGANTMAVIIHPIDHMATIQSTNHMDIIQDITVVIIHSMIIMIMIIQVMFQVDTVGTIANGGKCW